MKIETIKKAFPHAKKSNLDKYGSTLMDAMLRFDIDNAPRQSMFLAQIAHESASLSAVREYASGEAYEGRKDLGNTQSGDGVKFKGRGFLQLTGRANYQAFADWLGDQTIMTNPEKLEQPLYAALSAGFFWHVLKKLNPIADGNNEDAFLKVSKKINGVNKSTGLPNHWKERQDRWNEAKAAFKNAA